MSGRFRTWACLVALGVFAAPAIAAACGPCLERTGTPCPMASRSETADGQMRGEMSCCVAPAEPQTGPVVAPSPARSGAAVGVATPRSAALVASPAGSPHGPPCGVARPPDRLALQGVLRL